MPEFIFVMHEVTKVHPPDKRVLEDINLAFFFGAKIGVIGANGSGKSSLLRIMAQEDTDIYGEAEAPSRHQDWPLRARTGARPGPHRTRGGRAGGRRAARLSSAVSRKRAQRLGEPMSDEEMNRLLEQQAKLQDQIEASDAWNLDSLVEVAMDALRLPPPEAVVETLSGGEKRRVALCRVLLERPDLLLLDEPTNHLDAESVAWLEHYLEEYPGTVVAVTHDRYFLDNVAEWILELDRGRGYPFKGNYSGWLEQKAARLAMDEKQESARQRKLKRELEWVRSSPRARQAKSKARLGAYEELVAQSSQGSSDAAEISIPPGPRLGDLVIQASGLRKGYGERLLFDHLDFRLPRSGIVGVIGPNGAGKTTLFRLLVGEETPDQGSLALGETGPGRVRRPVPRGPGGGSTTCGRRSQGSRRPSSSASAR